MANILTLKRRIKAAENVSKTTRAMQMIAASKLKKAQEAALATRPYVEKLTTLTQNVSGKIDNDYLHPYMQQQFSSKKTLLILIAPDKGLCGGLITNLMREFFRYRDTEKNSYYITMGKKIESHVAFLKNEIIASFLFGITTPTFDMVYPVSRLIDEYFLSKQVDSVKLLSAHFSSIFLQKPTITTLLPIALPQTSEKTTEQPISLFEPDVNTIVSPLLTHYIEMTIYQLLLESFVSEQASRMIAMQNATDNAKDIIQDLRLEYNKTRQAKITNEILDITNTGIKAA